MVLFKCNNCKRGQAWSLDLIVASVIFSLSLVLVYVYAINNSSDANMELEEMFYEGNIVSDLILSEEECGILSDGKINQTKLEEFNSSYYYRKEQLNAKRNFYFVVPNLKINGISVSYGGLMNDTEIDYLVMVERITIYNNLPVKFNLYVWS